MPASNTGAVSLSALFRGVSPAVWRTLAVLALLLAALLFYSDVRPKTHRLRMTAGDALGRRHRIAKLLAEEARARGIVIELVPTSGSGEALDKLAHGELDLALVQGGIGERKGVAQVAALAVEPLHLLVKPALADDVTKQGLIALRGKRVNLSTPGSGTRTLALQALAFAGLLPGQGFQDVYNDYATLERLPYSQLPDALFTVSLMPSSVVEQLTGHNGYRVVPVRLSRALALRDAAVQEATIPAYAYGAAPPTPSTDVETIGTHLLLVAREKTAPDAVSRLLGVVFAGRFARASTLTLLPEEEIIRNPEMAVHPGARTYLNRNQPVFTSDKVEVLENLRSFLASIAVAGFFIWRWATQRRYLGFETYFKEVTRLEREALVLERQATPPVRELMRLRNELGAIKTEALERFARGELKGAELMSGFLTHVNDVRGYLSALIVAERERIADETRDTLPDDEQEERFRMEWAAAIATSE